MKCVWQVLGMMVAGVVLSLAQESAKLPAIEAPKVSRSMFSAELGMLDSERDEYATNLASFAATLATTTTGADAAEKVKRLLGLALHLSPRNKRAIVVSYQLSKGIEPESAGGDYTAQAFSRLLSTRGQLLHNQGGAENRRLSRYFIQLAAEMDPRNEDAVYESEVRRLDDGPLDWKEVVSSPQPEADQGR